MTDIVERLRSDRIIGTPTILLREFLGANVGNGKREVKLIEGEVMDVKDGDGS